MKRILLAVIAVFVVWQALDFVIHGLILMKSYEATANLWRPEAEMKMGLMRVAGLVAAITFVCIYAWLIRPKSVCAGLAYGLLFGVGAGFSMGFGTYSVMPITMIIAAGWFLGSIVETIVAGLLVGWILKEPLPSPAAAEPLR